MTSFLLAVIEVGQGIAISIAQGLEIIRKDVAKQVRNKERGKRMADSVRADLERL